MTKIDPEILKIGNEQYHFAEINTNEWEQTIVTASPPQVRAIPKGVI
jgi:hypothetical protein